MSSKIIISGIGIISGAGNSTNANFANMCKGIRFPKESPSIFKSEFRKPVFECDSSILQKDLLPYERTLALAYKALDEAINDAKITKEQLKKAKVGVCIGTTVACTLNNLEFYSEVRKGKTPSPKPLERYIYGDISQSISSNLSLNGPVATIANACASGTNAIAIGYSWIKNGYCDIVIAGGTDELNLIPYSGFNSLQVMSDEFCRPFDSRRKGLNLGEGAGILILENENSAKQREASTEVQIVSTGAASDAFHLTGPHPEGKGLSSAIYAAFKQGEINETQIDYINAHGTSTINNDKTEAIVFAKLAEIAGKNINFSSTKFYTGHTLGAAGAIEAAICIKGIKEGLFPGQPKVSNTNNELPILPSSKNISYNGNAVISTSMAFGGSCAALIFKYNDKKIFSSSNIPKKSISIIGKGIIGPFGKGIEEFKKALIGNDLKPANLAKIPDKILKTDPEIKKIRRRADKISLMMLSAAKDAVNDAKKNLDIEKLDNETAVVIATGFGAINTTFKFLDGILDFGETAPSPTHFSNSVHNAPAFYITSHLQLTGESVTFTGLKNTFNEAFEYSSELIQNNQFKNVLLVAGDETGDILQKMADIWYNSIKKEKITIGEGAVALLLSATTKSNLKKNISNDKIDSIFGTTPVNKAFALLKSQIDY